MPCQASCGLRRRLRRMSSLVYPAFLFRCLIGFPRLNGAYTSLYSLHDFDWRHPFPATTLAKDTPKIHRILQCFDNIRHSEKHAPDDTPEFRGTPALALLRAALQ
ncbi:unnamed protein product, partial [Dibothriocephalus latus]